ncbi:TPA: chemotaxis protein [Vibrio vulnificus]|jgi:hypothetical protein|uniref:Chemotaxis protein n=1 Tax=Vibrio vulnificus TaxID=672 RepID=A0A854GPG6_VIBVL|nr:hypothetical protein [Vibrio vulnificus]EGQ7930297.1 chemotaxis protein [Vibrio vulnificus]EGQ7951860.1 chemotaxis protein [Vibrio vulnificus]EGQ7995888.1 chemotaxis protein [Vibrio vulnificus]EGQ8091635.1 chemotaxis protein [Vibrio vulnificus]EGQ9291206.1 chemotaxis protein [Vibrio vulnificus]
MGGSSSSSNKTNTTNVTGQNAISGDNLGTAISGVNNSTINVESTDYGAIEQAFTMGRDLIAVTESMNLSNNQFAQSAIETNAVLAGTMLEEFSSSNSENLQMLAGLAGNQANQNAENLKAIKELAQFNKDGGQAKQSEMNLYLLFFIAAVLGFVTYKAVR